MAAIQPDRFFIRVGDAPQAGAAPEGAASSELIGGKARSLRELAALGLPVPPAIAVTTELLAALRHGGPSLPDSLVEPNALHLVAEARRALAAAPWPPGFPEKLAVEIDKLAPVANARYSVRSSADVEDRGDALAAGLFLSRTDVAGGEVIGALRAVLLSALSPAVVAYFAGRGLPASALRVAVLIHPFVVGEASGTAAFDPAAPQPFVIETGAPALASSARQRLEGALRTVAAARGPSEVEWVAAGAGLLFLQLRPFRRGRSRRADPPDPFPAGTGRWRWDAAHNPMPLSPAQAGLVAIVDERCQTGLRQRVEGGYLFFAADAAANEVVADGDGDARASGDPEQLFRGLADRAEERLAQPEPTLEGALDTFVAIYEPLFGVVQPSTRRDRSALADFLRRHGCDPAPLLPPLLRDVPSAATRRASRARAIVDAASEKARRAELAAYLDEFGDESPSWDVSAPTWRETPEALEGRLNRGPASVEQRAGARRAAEEIAHQLPPQAHPEWEETLARARAAAAVAEDDDWLYARLQAHVRGALLREGARLAARGVLRASDEIFWLPLEIVRREARGEIALAAGDAATLVEEARRRDRAARATPPAIAPSAIAELDRRIVRGRAGAGGAQIGRVCRYDPGTERGGAHGAVLVARTLLPTELPLLSPAAIVVETGGSLDHVAVQARERGIPAVVGAAGACDQLRDGDSVLVDGDAGLVIRLA